MAYITKKNCKLRKKYGANKKKKPGISGSILCLLVVLSCLLVTPALAQPPEPNGYVADKPLVEYNHDTIRGGLYYNIGSSYYSGKIYPGSPYTVSHNVNLPEGAVIKFARAYVYWTWSAERITGKHPELNLNFNGADLEPEQEYNDRKGWGIYDYPVGTWAYNVSDYLPGSGVYNSGITNTGPAASFFCIDGVGLLVVYTDPNGKDIEYWISEGADELNSQMDLNGDPLYYTTPNQTICDMLKPTLKHSVSKATLWTVIQSGNWEENTLLVNEKAFPGICNGKPYADLDLDVRDVTDCLVSGENAIRFQAIGDYAVPSNSFLILEIIPGSEAEAEPALEVKGPGENGILEEPEGANQNPETATTPGFGFGFTLALLGGGKLAAGHRFSKWFSIKPK